MIIDKPTYVNKLVVCKEEFTFITNSIDVNFPIAFIVTNNPFIKKRVYNTYLFEKITGKLYTLSFGPDANRTLNLSRTVL